MEQASEDEDTIEFEIEVVQSSSSSNSLALEPGGDQISEPQPAPEPHSLPEPPTREDAEVASEPPAPPPSELVSSQESRLSEISVAEAPEVSSQAAEPLAANPQQELEGPLPAEASLATSDNREEDSNRTQVEIEHVAFANDLIELEPDSGDDGEAKIELSAEQADEAAPIESVLSGENTDLGECPQEDIGEEIPVVGCEPEETIETGGEGDGESREEKADDEELKPPREEPRRLEGVKLVRETAGQLELGELRIEPVALLGPSESSEAPRIERVEIVHVDEVDLAGHEAHIELEVSESEEANSGEPTEEKQLEEVRTLIKVIEIASEPPADEFVNTPASSIVSQPDDLEWEFDNEPPFETRLVEVKRNREPQTEYELGEELGRGRFGTVLRCVERASGRKLAAKFIKMRRKEDREEVEREVAIMSLLQHRRLLQLYDAFDDSIANQMCLITELVEGGELFERIIDHDFELTERKAAIFMRQICEAVEYMHSKSIVHLDMKPENILCLSKTCNRIKLIDFGLARVLKQNDQLRLMMGTPDFAAPEVLSYDLVSLATDMWSVGVICYVLLSGISPFMGDTDMETMANVIRATYDFDYEAFEPISELAKDFISRLLIREPTKRLKPEECLRHDWLARGGLKLELSARNSRRQSMINEIIQQQRQSLASLGLTSQEMARLEEAAAEAAAEAALALAPSTPPPVSLDKRNLKKYVVRRKWHKTVHAIMALGRMGANLMLKLGSPLELEHQAAPEPPAGE